jgi:hypothetical protein
MASVYTCGTLLSSAFTGGRESAGVREEQKAERKREAADRKCLQMPFSDGGIAHGAAHSENPYLKVALRGVEEDVDGHALILVKLLGQKLAVDEPDGLVDVHSAVGVGLEDEIGSDGRSASALRASMSLDANGRVRICSIPGTHRWMDAKIIVRETSEGQQRGMLAWERASTTGFLKFWLLGVTAPPPDEC